MGNIWPRVLTGILGTLVLSSCVTPFWKTSASQTKIAQGLKVNLQNDFRALKLNGKIEVVRISLAGQDEFGWRQFSLLDEESPTKAKGGTSLSMPDEKQAVRRNILVKCVEKSQSLITCKAHLDAAPNASTELWRTNSLDVEITFQGEQRQINYEERTADGKKAFERKYNSLIFVDPNLSQQQAVVPSDSEETNVAP